MATSSSLSTIPPRLSDFDPILSGELSSLANPNQSSQSGVRRTPGSIPLPREEPREQLVDAVGARRHEPVVAVEVRDVRGERHVRIAGASITVAPSSRSRAASGLAWARSRGRVTATVRPCSGRRSSHASCSRSAATGPTTVTAGARMPLVRGPRGDVGERAGERPLARQRPALDHRDRLAGRAALDLQALGDPLQRAHPM